MIVPVRSSQCHHRLPLNVMTDLYEARKTREESRSMSTIKEERRWQHSGGQAPLSQASQSEIRAMCSDNH